VLLAHVKRRVEDVGAICFQRRAGVMRSRVPLLTRRTRYRQVGVCV
jgi:hypothetical protein